MNLQAHTKIATLKATAKDNFGNTYPMIIETSYIEGCNLLCIRPDGKPAWYLADFMKNNINTIDIDSGQSWSIINKLEIIASVREWLGLEAASWKGTY